MRRFAVRSLQLAARNARIAPRRASQNASAPKPRATRRAENASPPSMAQNRLPAYDTVSYIRRKGKGMPSRIAINGTRARKGAEHGHETALWHGSSPFQRRIASSEIADLGFRREGTPSRDEGAPSPCQNAVSWPFSGRFRARARRPARRAQLIRPARPTRLARPTRSAHLIWPAYPTSKNRPSRAPRLLARKKQRAPALPGPAKTQSTTRTAAPQRYASAYSSLSFTRCS